MKKILFCLFVIFLCPNVFATEMCANEDTIVIPLSTDMKTTSKYGGDGFNAYLVHPVFGRFYFKGTYFSEAEGGNVAANSYKNSFGEYYPTDGSVDYQGYNSLDANGNKRTYCWCRVSHPFSGAWFKGYFPGSVSCANGCVQLAATGNQYVWPTAMNSIINTSK